MIDTFGTPEYFATTTKLEYAGDGCIRIINCIKRGGVTVPVCSVIFPMAAVMRIVDATRDFAKSVPALEVKANQRH